MAPIPKPASPADRLKIIDTSTDNQVYSLSGTSQGDEGCGKTRLWLTAPGPIICFQSDPAGMRGVVEDAAKDKDVRVFEYDFNPKLYKTDTEVQRAAAELWERFAAEVKWAQQQCRTLIWDKEDFFWMLLRHARFGKGSDRANNYEPLYFEYRSLIYSMFEHNLNFGAIRGTKEKWAEKPKPGDPTKTVGFGTGIFIPRGMKEVPELLQVVFNHGWSKDEGYFIDLGKCRVPGGAQGMLTRGQRLSQDQCDFATIGQLAYPDSSEEDWK
jgi:hypothetical protein